jgi:hypothetical protein
VRSGAVNAGGAVEIRATASADESTYAGIVRMAQQAAAESAPVVRLADRVHQPVRGAVRCACDGKDAALASREQVRRGRKRRCWFAGGDPVGPSYAASGVVSGTAETGKLGSRHHAGAGQDGHGDQGRRAVPMCRRTGVDAFEVLDCPRRHGSPSLRSDAPS